MAPRRPLLIVLLSLVVFVAPLVAACSARAPALSNTGSLNRSPLGAPAAAPAAPAAAAPTAAPAAAPEGSPAQPKEVPAPAGRQIASADTISAAAAAEISPYQATRKIIKDGQMNLVVKDTDRAIDQVTSIAVDSGGYVLSSQTSTQDGFKSATIKMGVPVDQFENVMRQLRSIAFQVTNESSSGQDVSDEYVDQQSRLTNLEATAARVREFLKQATTAEEALKVNAQLSEIEGEIEQVKGRINYLKDRAAYSTLLVNLEPLRPTPTATPSPTPEAWLPSQTFNDASGALGTLLKAIGNLAIWVVVLLGPFAAMIGVLAFIVVRLRARARQNRQAPPAPQAPVA